MKLIPKAKPVRIRVSSGGREHSTLHSLLDSFRIDDIRPLLKNGVIFKWLEQIGENRLRDRLRSEGEDLTDAELISIFFDTPDKIVEYAERAMLEHDPHALDYLKHASDMGNPRAAYRLGCVYYFQCIEGVYADVVQAEKYFSQASGRNYPLAKLAYGSILCSKQNYSKAFELIDKTLDLAVDRDCRMPEDRKVIALAYYALGEIYWCGNKSVRQSSAKAIECFLRAAESGYDKAYTRLGKIYMNSRKLNGKALEYLEKARTLMDPEGIYQLGLLYERLERPDFEICKMFRMAAVGGWEESWFHLGFCYYYGTGIGKDINEAAKCFERALNYYCKESEAGDSFSSHHFEADKAKELLKKCRQELETPGDVKQFSAEIKPYTLMSARDVIAVAARNGIPKSRAIELALKLNPKLRIKS